MWFDVGGACSLAVGNAVESAVASFVRARMKPYLPQPGVSPVDVAIARDASAGLDASGGGNSGRHAGARRNGESRFGDGRFADIEGEAGDGLTTAWDGERAFVLRCDRWCAVPDALRDSPAVFSYQPGFPVWDVWASLVRPALSLAALRHDAVVVHASAVEIGGRAVLVGGWSESGKTEVALALAEIGAAFVSDKWTLVRGDGTVVPFPSSVGIRRWVLPYLPKLNSGLPRAGRVQFAGAGVAEAMTRPLRGRTASQALLREAVYASDRVAALADRVALSTAQVRRIYGGSVEDECRPVPLSTVVLLNTVRGADWSLDSADCATVAARLARAAAFERRAYFSVGERIAYAAGGSRRAGAAEAMSLEEGLLGRLFGGSIVLEARTDFPSDPRGLAAAIREAAAS
jgi:hypothetical protein